MSTYETVHGRLGKAPFVPDGRDFKAATFMGDTLKAPPANFGHGSIFHDGEDPFLDWDMNGNGPDPTAPEGAKDGVGDCVWAAGAHTTRAVAKVMGRHVVITGKESVSDYTSTGYIIGQPQTDGGTVMRDGMKYRQKTGLLDHAGKRHKIGAYASITPGDWDELMLAAWTFDAVELGFNFQQAQEDQFDQGTWDFDPSSEVVGGHAIPLFGRNKGRGGVVSWAKHLWVTRAFVENLVDEAWAIVYPDSLNAKGVNDRGLNVDQLNAALASLR